MGAADIKRWIGIGLLGLPLYGALTFYSSLDPQPAPNTHYDAWTRYVTTDHYVLSHLFASDLGLILAIFGTFALGAYLATSRVGRMGLVAMAIAVFGSALFLLVGGVSTFPNRSQPVVSARRSHVEKWCSRKSACVVPLLTDLMMLVRRRTPRR